MIETKVKLCFRGDVFVYRENGVILWSPYALHDDARRNLQQAGVTFVPPIEREMLDAVRNHPQFSTWIEQLSVIAGQATRYQ